MLSDELLKKLADKLADKIKGDEGKPGKDGKTPTEKELVTLILSILAKFKNDFIIKGDKGDKGDSIQGKPGRDGETPIFNKDFFNGTHGKDGRTLKHEYTEKGLRFENPDGTWGEWIDFNEMIGSIAERYAAILRAKTTKKRFFTPVGTRIASQTEVDAGTEDNKIVTPATLANYSIIVANTAKNSYPSADSAKLAGIEASATADQTGAEIKTAYEAENNTNAFTDAEKTLLGNQLGTNTGDEPTASTTVAGISELATDAEAFAKSLSTRALTPSNLDSISKTVFKSSTETVNNSTTMQDDNKLLFTTGGIEKWAFSMFLIVTSSSIADIKLGFSVSPSLSSLISWGDTSFTPDTKNSETSVATYSCNGTDQIIFLNGYISSIQASTITLQWAQNTAEVSNTRILIGSYIKLDRLV